MSITILNCIFECTFSTLYIRIPGLISLFYSPDLGLSLETLSKAE